MRIAALPASIVLLSIPVAHAQSPVPVTVDNFTRATPGDLERQVEILRAAAGEWNVERGRL